MFVNDADGAPSEELTPETAAPVFESFLSDMEDTEDPETPPVQQSPEPEPESEEEASPEPAAQDEDGESDEESSEEAEETEEAPVAVLDPSTVVRVKVDGVEHEVTLDEALKGYSRTSDYTRKTQEHAEKVRAFETESHAVREERQMYAARLQQLEQALTDATPQEPDWDKVQRETPDEFPMLRAQWSLHKERMDMIRAERMRAEQVLQYDQQLTRQKYLQAEQDKLFEALPEWKNPESSQKAKANMVAYVKNMGYSAEEIGNVTDHRLIVLIDKAMKYDASQAKKPAIKTRIEKVKAVTPGPAAGAKTPKLTETQARLKRLAKTGKQDDFAAVLEMTLED